MRENLNRGDHDAAPPPERCCVFECVCTRTRCQNLTVYGLLLNTIRSNGPIKTKYVYCVNNIGLLSFTVRLFSTTALHRSPPRRRRRPRDAALTVLFASRVVVVVGASSSSFIGTHHAVRDVAFTRAIIRARVVVARVVGRRATRCDIGGAWDVIDYDGFFATGVRVVASRERRGGWRVVVVRVTCVVVARWWGHGMVGARCVDVVVKDGSRGTTRLDKKRFETRARDRVGGGRASSGRCG